MLFARWRGSRHRTVRLLACLAVILLLSGCASREEKIAQFIQSGDTYMEKNDPARAAVQYKNALQLDPKNVPATLALARAYEVMKEYQRAFGTYRQVLELDPDRDDARLGLARLLAWGRKGEEALAELDKIRDPQALEPHVSVVRARALLALGRAEEAADVLEKAPGAREDKDAAGLSAFVYERLDRDDAFREAVERWRSLDPQNPGSYLLTARHAAQKGRKEDAVEALRLMVQANGDDPRARLLQARSLEELGYPEEASAAFDALPSEPDYLREQAAFSLRRSDRKKAREILEKLVELTPAHADPVVQLAKVHADLGEPQEALAVLDRHLPQMKGEEDREKVLLAKGAILSALGRTDEAESICRQVLQDSQGSAGAHLLLARLLFGKKDFENAELHANQAAAALPENPEAQLLLARILRKNGKDALADDTLKQALERRPDDAALRLALLQSLTRARKYGEALALAEKALEIKPDDPAWLRVRGNLRAASNDAKGAEADFLRVIELRPDSPVGHLDLGRLYQAVGRFQKAEAAYRKAAQLAPRWPAPYRALAGLYMAQGRLDEAVRDAEKAYHDSPTAGLGMHLAGLYEFQGRYGEAASVYEDILNRWGESPDILNNLAFLYAQDTDRPDRLDRAREMAEKALQAQPDNPAFLDTLAVIAHKQGRLDEAWEIMEKALAAAPGIGEHHLHAALIARDRGDADKASREARAALEAGLPPRLQAQAKEMAE